MCLCLSFYKFCDLLDHTSIATINGFNIPEPRVSFHIDKMNNYLFSKRNSFFNLEIIIIFTSTNIVI
jgi:hypothetical protein